MKTLTDPFGKKTTISDEEHAEFVRKAIEQIKRNSPEQNYNVHYEFVILKNGEKALKRVCTPKKEKHD